MSFKKFFIGQKRSQNVLLESANMMDISIKNINKAIKTDEEAETYLNREVEVEEKVDGTKLTLIRNGEDWDADYTKNWIVAYKNHIIYAEEFDSVDRARAKTTSGNSQYAFVHDHLKMVHRKSENIPKNTELFCEFVMDKPTLTRDYKRLHKVMLIAYSPTTYRISHGRVDSKPQGFFTEDRDDIAEILDLDTPPVLFQGTLNNLPKGIKSMAVREAFDELQEDWEASSGLERIGVVEKLFTSFDSVYGGIPEGVVMNFEDGNILKVVQKDQYDKEVRNAKKARYFMDQDKEAMYRHKINDLANEVLSELDPENEGESLKALSKKIYSMKLENEITHELKGEDDIKDDIMIRAKTLLFKKRKGNNYAIFQGRLQPPTKAHIHIIEQALKDYDGVVVLLVRALKKDQDRNPFPLEIQEKILKSVFGNRVIIRTSNTGNLRNYVMNLDVNVNAVIAGSDRYEGYKKMFPPSSEIEVIEIPRTAEDISATKIREALADNDYETFKMNTDQRTWKFYKELKEYVDEI